ncbi:MAG: glycosyltransferase family 4 protein [Caldilineaceae bacterium]|nr:glycosyltransferase family 4 protein [Caldilineaceae bacterium]
MHIAVNGWFVGRPAAGSGQYIHHLLEHLPRQAAGVRLSVLLPGPAQPVAWPWPGTTPQPLALPPLPAALRKLWWEQVAVPRAARRLAADLLWVPYWAAPLWQPCPVCVTVHDLIPLLLPAYRGGVQHRLYTALVGRAARRAAAVLTVSQASKCDIVRHLAIPPGRVHVVYHGPNQEGHAAPDGAHLAAVRAKYALPPRFFLYLGGFDVRKNLAGTIQAYRRYLERGGDPAVKLVLGGKLPERDSAFAPDPRRLAAAQGLGDQVLCCGWVEEADKPALYALATAFVFPSLYEGFGMMVLEAMAAGTPVITSASPASA